MPPKATKKGPSDEDLIAAAAKEFVSKGYEQTSFEDLAESSGLTSKEMRTRFSTKDELVAQAFKIGRQSMELSSQRLVGTPFIRDYLFQVFDGLVAGTGPWGPQGYVNIFYQATKNKELRGLVKKASQDILLVLKFYINDMIDHDLIPEKVRLEPLAEEFLAKFIESLATLTEGKSIEEVKRQWIEDATLALTRGVEERND